MMCTFLRRVRLAAWFGKAIAAGIGEYVAAKKKGEVKAGLGQSRGLGFRIRVLGGNGVCWHDHIY